MKRFHVITKFNMTISQYVNAKGFDEAMEIAEMYCKPDVHYVAEVAEIDEIETECTHAEAAIAEEG